MASARSPRGKSAKGETQARPSASDPIGSDPTVLALSDALLDWYDRSRRVLPWRALPGQASDPYAVWLSEIMLQQTTVAAVIPYFLAFRERWPTVEALAAAPVEDVMAAWAGLGYYARARNLHRCAGVIASQHGGRFPETETELRNLPGIGAYTAAAVAAIAFGAPATPVDGNIERVIARLRGVTAPLPGAKETLRALAAELTPPARPGDYAQAAMDLGATICTPRKPKCILCPWQAACVARRQGIAETLPAKAPKPDRPQRFGVAFWLVRGDGAVLIRWRPPQGLLGGMMEIPSTDWRADPWRESEAMRAAPVAGVAWRPLSGVVRHGFTHFLLELTVLAGIAKGFKAVPGADWCLPDAIAAQGLPSVMRKVVAHALKKL